MVPLASSWACSWTRLCTVKVTGAVDIALGFVAGILIATVTAPVGVSGAVFLLPVQLSILNVANPAVAPTNLLYNVLAGPGALLRYRRSGQLGGPLTRLLLFGTVPGVVCGAIIRVLLLPGERPFRIVAGVVLFSIGTWLLARTVRTQPTREPLTNTTITFGALVVGVIGGIYGIGGGSILSPILAGSGMAVSTVAPAALASTFITSIVGAATYTLLAFVADGSIAPAWPIGVACGLGGLFGGYLGARLQLLLPDRGLRVLLGALAIGIAVFYLYRGLR